MSESSLSDDKNQPRAGWKSPDIFCQTGFDLMFFLERGPRL